MRLNLQLAVWIIGCACFVSGRNALGAGAVYVVSNQAPHNSVFVYDRADDGTLALAQEVSTHGAGTGVTLDPLVSQGALAMSADGKLLFAVNPASGDVSAFTVSANRLSFASKAPSGGAFPVSVTVKGRLVYVLNHLGTANISGFPGHCRWCVASYSSFDARSCRGPTRVTGRSELHPGWDAAGGN